MILHQGWCYSPMESRVFISTYPHLDHLVSDEKYANVLVWKDRWWSEAFVGAYVVRRACPAAASCPVCPALMFAGSEGADRNHQL